MILQYFYIARVPALASTFNVFFFSRFVRREECAGDKDMTFNRYRGSSD
jgi:hypothetical protein